MASEARDLSEEEARRIVELCYDDVLAYCRRHAPRGHEAADLAQETFLRFMRRGRYAEEGKPLAYLLAIARNLCADAARQARRAPASASLDACPGLDAPDPRDEVADVELACMLARLEPELRDVIELRFGEGLKAEEAAQVLGVSRFTVRRRLKRALDQLRRELAVVD